MHCKLQHSFGKGLYFISSEFETPRTLFPPTRLLSKEVREVGLGRLFEDDRVTLTDS